MNNFTEGSPFKRSNAWGRVGEETTLARWIKMKNLTFDQVAKMLGASPRSTKYWAHGQSIPCLLFAFKIEQVTKGKVPVASWLGLAIARAKWPKGEGE